MARTVNRRATKATPADAPAMDAATLAANVAALEAQLAALRARHDSVKAQLSPTASRSSASSGRTTRPTRRQTPMTTNTATPATDLGAWAATVDLDTFAFTNDDVARAFGTSKTNAGRAMRKAEKAGLVAGVHVNDEKAVTWQSHSGGAGAGQPNDADLILAIAHAMAIIDPAYTPAGPVPQAPVAAVKPARTPRGLARSRALEAKASTPAPAPADGAGHAVGPVGSWKAPAPGALIITSARGKNFEVTASPCPHCGAETMTPCIKTRRGDRVVYRTWAHNDRPGAVIEGRVVIGSGSKARAATPTAE